MLKAIADKITLNFKRPAGTSRGILKNKNSWIIKVWDSENPLTIGMGEVSIIENLSPEWSIDYEAKIQDIVQNIHHISTTDLLDYPSIRFGVEAALLDLKNGGKQVYYNSDFTDHGKGIRINGLIWMGDKAFMQSQIEEKLKAGFTCLKLKIGALDFEQEIDLLKFIRSQFKADELELRVDANGAFDVSTALQKLDVLSQFKLHSIEQPIEAGQLEKMANLCKNTPIPIALDEELIGISDVSLKTELLKQVQPQYIILKPSLIGGFIASDEWITAAEILGINWWITSALETNVGLNAIAQYAATKNNPMPQGLGTGLLFLNNTPSNLKIEGQSLFFH